MNKNDLYNAILALRDQEECAQFFEDLCTVKEIQAMAQRYAVAKMLKDGVVYADIVASTGASTATISRVNRSLAYGRGGYKLVFARQVKPS